MAYNPYSAVNAIYNLKGQWDNANNAGDTTTKNNIAAKAQAYYKQLRDNGRDDIADQLTASNYAQAKAINDQWAKQENENLVRETNQPLDYIMSTNPSETSEGGKDDPAGLNAVASGGASNGGNIDSSAAENAINDKRAKMGKTSTRDYLYSLGKSYGMSSSDIDKLISWDNQTGEVSFGGKKIGTPDSVVDGVSYWSDASVLDNAFNDYVSRSGTVRSKSTAVNQENENLFSKYNQTYDDLITTNPFETDTAKAILAKYDLAGLQGRDNAVASGGASNSGNIDSYAAANAMRQQASLVNQGQMAVLDAHQQKIDNVRGLLSDMGVNIDRVFNQDETSKINNVAMLSEQANVTGYTPSEWTIANDDVYNTYLNADGTFKKELENVDIQALINSAKASGDTETAKKLAVVRAKKMLGNYGEFGKYVNEGDISYMSPQITEARRESEQNDATVRETLNTEKEISANTNQTNKDIAANTNQTNKDIAANTNQTNKDIAANASGGSGVYKLSDADISTAELVSDTINSNLISHRSNPDGRKLITYKDGVFTLNLPEGHKHSWWRTQILGPLFKSNLSAEAAYTIAKQLGFSDEEITDVANAIK